MKLLLFCLTIVVFLASCDINEPQLAKWDTSWQVHLRGDVVTMRDLLDDSSLSDSVDAVTGEEMFFFSNNDSSEKKTVERDKMALKGKERRFRNTLGVFKVNQPEPKSTPSTTFGDVFSSYNPQPGMLFPQVDPLTLNPPPREVTLDGFQEIHIESATMSVVFYNDMIVGVDEGMELVLFDKARQGESNGGLIDTFYFDQAIPTGSSAQSNTVDLAGKMLSNNLELQYTVPVSGTDSAMVLTEEDINSGFYSEVRMSEVEVSRALAQIPEQTFNSENVTPLDSDDHKIRSADVEQGKLYLSVQNMMNIDGSYDLELTNFVDDSGQPKTKSFTVAAQSAENISINLAGYTLKSADGSFLEDIRYQVVARTSSTDDYVWVDAQDSLALAFTMDSLYFSRFEGQLSQTEIVFDPIRETDLLSDGKFDGAMTLPDLVLQFDFHNEINFDVFVELNVTGIKKSNSGVVEDSVTLHVSQLINRASLNKAAITSMVLNKASSSPSIVDLMAIMPDELVVSGRAQVQGDGSVNSGDRIWATYRMESPLTVNVTEKLVYEGDRQVIDEDDISQEERDKITEKLSEVSLAFNTLNGLPLTTRFKIYVAADSTELFNDVITDSSRKVILSANIQNAAIGNNGYVQEAVEGRVDFRLSSRQMEVFENETVYTAVKAEIDPTGQSIRFRPQDELRFEGVISFDAVVDPENF